MYFSEACVSTPSYIVLYVCYISLALNHGDTCSQVHSFSLMGSNPLNKYTIIYLFILLSVDIWVSSYCCSAVTDNAATNILV